MRPVSGAVPSTPGQGDRHPIEQQRQQARRVPDGRDAPAQQAFPQLAQAGASGGQGDQHHAGDGKGEVGQAGQQVNQPGRDRQAHAGEVIRLAGLQQSHRTLHLGLPGDDGQDTQAAPGDCVGQDPEADQRPVDAPRQRVMVVVSWAGFFP